MRAYFLRKIEAIVSIILQLLMDHNGRYLPSGVNIRFGMYPRDNIAQKDGFTHLFLQPLQYFCAQIPRELFGGESQRIFEFEPINRVLLQRYPLFQCLLIPIILIQTSRERHYFMPRKPLSGRYSHSLFSWPAKYHPWPKQTNLQ